MKLENRTAFWLKSTDFQGFDEAVAQRHTWSHIHHSALFVGQVDADCAASFRVWDSAVVG